MIFEMQCCPTLIGHEQITHRKGMQYALTQVTAAFLMM